MTWRVVAWVALLGLLSIAVAASPTATVRDFSAVEGEDADERAGHHRRASSAPTNASAVIVTGPASCETCIVFDGARWCPNTLMCYMAPPEVDSKTVTPAERRAAYERVISECRDGCGEECSTIAQCFATANKSCGDCVFVGGWWSPQLDRCFIGSKSSDDVKNNCFLGNDEGVCLRHDNQCPECSRIYPPLRCTPQIAAVIVSGIFSFIFLVVLGYTCFRSLRLKRSASEGSAEEDDDEDEASVSESKRSSRSNLRAARRTPHSHTRLHAGAGNSSRDRLRENYDVYVESQRRLRESNARLAAGAPINASFTGTGTTGRESSLQAAAALSPQVVPSLAPDDGRPSSLPVSARSTADPVDGRNAPTGRRSSPTAAEAPDQPGSSSSGSQPSKAATLPHRPSTREAADVDDSEAKPDE